MKELRKYIRHGRTPVGCVVAVKKDNTVKIGYSYCSPKDHFSKAMAVKIAHNRAVNGFHFDRIPEYAFEEITGEMGNMKARAERYFQQEVLVQP